MIRSFKPSPARWVMRRFGTSVRIFMIFVSVTGGICLVDDIDREAHSHMEGRRSRFSAKEVSIMMLGKVALTYLAGDMINLSFYVPIRDVLRQRMPLLAKDKTTKSIICSIRRNMKRPKIRHSMSHYLMRLMNDKELVAKYKQAVKPNNRKVECAGDLYTNITSLINDLIDKFMLFEMNQSTGVLPMSLRWLEEHCEVNLAEEGNSNGLWNDVASFTDICSVTLRDFQLSHVLSVGDKQARDYELYATLQQYPDHIVTETFTQLVNRRLIAKNRKYSNGSAVTGIARYVLNNNYLLRLQQARHPVHLFNNSADLLSTLSMAAQTTGESGGEEHGGQTVTAEKRGESDGEGWVDECRQSVGRHIHYLPQGTASAGHVALAIGLTAVHKLHMVIETNAEVIDINSSKEAYLKDMDTGLAKKRGFAQSRKDSDHDNEDSDHDNEDGEKSEGQDAEGGKRQQSGRRSILSEPLAKRARKDSDNGVQIALLHPTHNKQCPSPAACANHKEDTHTLSPGVPQEGSGQKRTLCPESSSEEECDAGSANKKFCQYPRPATDCGELFITSLRPGQEDRVREEGEGKLRMDSDDVTVRFCKKSGIREMPTAKEARFLNTRVSFTLLAMRRIIPKCKLDPRKYSSSNRLSLNLSRLALALKDKEVKQYAHTVPSVIEMPSATSSAVLPVVVESSSCTTAPLPDTEVMSATSVPGVDEISDATKCAVPIVAVTSPASSPFSVVEIPPAASRGAPLPVSEVPPTDGYSTALPDAFPHLQSPQVRSASGMSSCPHSPHVTSASARSSHPKSPHIPFSPSGRQTESVQATGRWDMPVWIQPSQSGLDSLYMDPALMKRMVHQQIRQLPFSMDWEKWWQHCQEALDGDSYSACQQMYRHIVSAGVLGTTWSQLKAEVRLPVEVLYDSLQFLLSEDVTGYEVARDLQVEYKVSRDLLLEYKVSRSAVGMQSIQRPAVGMQGIQRPAVGIQGIQRPAAGIQSIQRPAGGIQGIQKPAAGIQASGNQRS